MAPNIDKLMTTLRRAYPTSHVRLLPEPAMFLRSNTGRTYPRRGHAVPVGGVRPGLCPAYINGLLERIRETEDYELNEAHPWIIGVHPGDLTSSPLIFIFGNIIRSGKEEWVQIGYPRYENLEFSS